MTQKTNPNFKWIILEVFIALAVSAALLTYVNHVFVVPKPVVTYTIKCENNGETITYETSYKPWLTFGTFRLKDGRTYVIPGNSTCDYSPKDPDDFLTISRK